MPALRPADVNSTVDYRLLERVLERMRKEDRLDRFAELVFAATGELEREERRPHLTLVGPLQEQ